MDIALCVQEYIDDLENLLKVATHPRSTVLLEKALDEAKSEGKTNGTQETDVEVKPTPHASVTASAPIVKTERTVYSTRISQYGNTTYRYHNTVE